jgi:hypothetical protein
VSYAGTFQAFSLGATRCHLLVPLVRSRCESSVEKKPLVTPSNRAPLRVSTQENRCKYINIYWKVSKKVYKYINTYGKVSSRTSGIILQHIKNSRHFMLNFFWEPRHWAYFRNLEKNRNFPLCFGNFYFLKRHLKKNISISSFSKLLLFCLRCVCVFVCGVKICQTKTLVQTEFHTV